MNGERLRRRWTQVVGGGAGRLVEWARVRVLLITATSTICPFPYWLKTAFSTAGRGVGIVADERSRAEAERELLEQASAPVMAQPPATGQYGPGAGSFDHGRLIAVHTSVQTGTGIGPSAAARLSVDHPIPRGEIATPGGALARHAGLTLCPSFRSASRWANDLRLRHRLAGRAVENTAPLPSSSARPHTVARGERWVPNSYAASPTAAAITPAPSSSRLS